MYIIYVKTLDYNMKIYKYLYIVYIKYTSIQGNIHIHVMYNVIV